MKNKVVFVLFIIVVLIAIYLLYLKNSNKKITNISYFNYSYTVGYHYEASIVYKLIRHNNTYIIKIKDEGKTEEELREYEVNNEFALKLNKILNNYNVYRWNGFRKYDKNVLDGNSFNLDVKFDNGTIEADGYMKWPKNYKMFKNDIDELFNSLRGDKNGKDV